MSLIINDKKVAGLYKAYVIQNATNTASGIIRIATEEEVKAGLDSLTAVTPKQLATKQNVLIAGNGLEILEDGTINNTQTSAEWGNIIGNILDQEDLNTILLTKANTEETAYELVYENSILTLKNRKGDILSEVSIDELPDVDNSTIIINEENKLQSIGEKTKSGTFKYTWIGTEAEYTEAKDLGIIDEFTECIIIDSEAEKVVPIVQYEAPTKLSELANDIEFVTNDKLQSVKTSLENKIDLQTDGAEIVHKVGNETIDGFKNFKQKIVIENGLNKGRIAHKPVDTSLEDGYIEFGDNTLLYGKQNINGELYDEKYDIFHAGNLVAGSNITITEKNGIYSINGKAGGGTGEPSTNVLVDDITIVKDDNDIITTVGIKSKNDTILYDWIGTENEYNIALGNGTIQPNWICYITDDTLYTDDIRPEINRLDNIKSNVDLSNLTQEGEKHFLNKSQITNCILEIPQRIKLELNNGTLTLKAGSEVTVPNGFEADGVTHKFDYVTIESDLTLTITQSNTYQEFLFINSNNQFEAIPATYCTSGDTKPTTFFGTYATWYDTTNNKLKITSDSGSTWAEGLCLPIALFTITTTAITSIDQVFNGIGYIGSTYWLDKGVKVLASNGRNEDGTIKNIEFVNDKVLINTTSNKNHLNNLWLRGINKNPNITNYWSENFHYIKNRNELPLATEQNYQVYYIKDEAIWLSNGSTGVWSINPSVVLGTNYLDANSKINNFQPKQPFIAIDYSDKTEISGWGMPSDRYINLTLGATGTQYTAPANGWISINKSSTGASQYLELTSATGSIAFKVFCVASGQNLQMSVPVRRGEIFNVYYSLGGTTHKFRFNYAEGENK